MDIARAFTYFSEDDRWIGKLGIGVLISLVSFLILPAFLLYGYAVGITRNVMNGEKLPLPEWEDLGTLFKDGLVMFVAGIVYTLPFWLLACIAFTATIGFGGLSEATQISEDAAVAGIMATCFRFGEVLAIVRDNFADILIAGLTPFLASFVLSIVFGVLNIIPCLGTIVAFLLSFAVAPYLSTVTGHLYGQIAGKIGGAPPEEKFAG